MEIKKQIRSTPQVGVKPYSQIHAHSTGNPNSTAQNEADYMIRKDLNSGFYTHVVGNGQVIQTAETNRGAYDVGGSWNYETYAAVELIESHTTRKEFDRDYRLYVDLLRQLAKEAGIPLTLDTKDLAGIKTHMFCTYNQPNNGSDHIDPYPYLNKWGITVDQFSKDLANGFSNKEDSSDSVDKNTKVKDDANMYILDKVFPNGKVESWFIDGEKRSLLTKQDVLDVEYLLKEKGVSKKHIRFSSDNRTLKAIERKKEEYKY
ncbi:peptidoglycan recognition protein family protein [Enterococcus termitis]|uniref:peptidoglycan recognition protein family protein n=1 Tax=Enterococcus termitis TaxID=332950 RepID=UPI0009246657|nr:N-acetylmuramoyl-L-alanine amidase [Enterococcus termitis]OJG97171.1 hypothetical protein RV18_GL001036 [Enterococcus termitis]